MTNGEIIDLANSIVCRIANDLQRRGSTVWQRQTAGVVKDEVVEHWHKLAEDVLFEYNRGE